MWVIDQLDRIEQPIELGTVEHHRISYDKQGLHITKQGLVPCLGLFGISSVMLVVLYVIGIWVGAAFCAIFSVVFFVCMFYTEYWTISDEAVRYSNSFQAGERFYSRPRGKLLVFRLLTDRDLDGPSPECDVYLIGTDADKEGIDLVFSFFGTKNPDRFVDTIRQVMPLRMVDERS